MDEYIKGELNDKSHPGKTVPVIIQTRTAPDNNHKVKIEALGGKVKKSLKVLNGIVADVPLAGLDRLSDDPQITRVSLDHTVHMTMDVTAQAIGADGARTDFGVDGSGATVALIDSGIDLTAVDIASRVIAGVDYTTSSPNDQYGHGTHVAGIIGGSGLRSMGNIRVFKGIAPNVNFVDLKVLDASGAGVVSNVISAIQWVIQNKNLYNIRIINLSLGHSPAESYRTDPLTIACQNAVNAGITVVAAAGNNGKNSLGQVIYGGITSPGDSPAVITVGAMKTGGAM